MAPTAVSPTPATDFHVPTVDISPFFEDPESPESDKIVEIIRKACVTHGFFQITGHGIPRELQKEIFGAAAEFFKLPFDVKKSLDAKSNIGHRGYDVLASQSYEDDVLPDLKEGFYIGEELPLDDPRVVAKRFFMGPNVWPSADKLDPSKFTEPTMKYFRAVYALSLKVFEILAKTLPYGPNVFEQFTSNVPATPLRLLHYPPAQKTTQRQLGASAHTDFSAITLLLQDGNPGLEVLNQETQEWVPIEPNTDAYVVNVGDMLSMWTKNEYKSSVHRVINKNPGGDRYSVVFFFDGNVDCPLAPLDGTAPEGKVLTAEEHMFERMRTTYGTGKKSK
jgi:isopenicillin N synthase-like dioxygenase